MTEAEFKQHVMPLYKKLYGYAFALLKNEQEASDCLQESVAKLWENRNRLESIENIAGYCMITVKRTAFDSLRRISADISVDTEPPDYVESSSSPERQMEDKEALSGALFLMKRLPESQRRVVMLSTVKGLSNAEIQKETGLSDENVRVLLSRGRKRLRELFGKQGF